MKLPKPQIVLCAAALTVLLWVSCSSPPSTTGPVTSGAAYETRAEIAGETTVDSVTTTNTIIAIDTKQRTMELRRPDGTTGKYVVGPEITSFDKLHVGDRIQATVVEEMAVDIEPSDLAERTVARTVVSQVNAGGKSELRKIDTYSITAKVMAIDPWLDDVTLQMAGGITRTVHVNEYVNLANMNVGDDVSVTMARSTTLALATP